MGIDRKLTVPVFTHPGQFQRSLHVAGRPALATGAVVIGRAPGMAPIGAISLVLIVVVVIAAVFFAVWGAGQSVIAIAVLMGGCRGGPVCAVLGALDSRGKERALANGLDVGL